MRTLGNSAMMASPQVFDDAPVVTLDQRSHGIAVTTQRRERAHFVGPHEAGVSLDFGAQERR